MPRFWVRLLLLTSMVVAAVPAVAHASFPGGNGKLLLQIYSSGQYDIWSMNPDGSGLTNTTNTPGDSESDGHWSPDGQKIVFLLSVSGVRQIWTANADGTNRQNVTPDVSGAPFYTTNARPNGVAWSPDGEEIAFTNEDGCAPGHSPGQLVVMDADGSNPERVVCTWPYVPPGTLKGAASAGPGWSPDGQRLILSGPWSLGCEADAWVVNRNGSGMTDITQGNTGDEFTSDWSPNGARISTNEYAPGCTDPPFIWTMDTNGANRSQPTTSVAGSPVWSPDNTKIAFEQGADVWLTNADGSGSPVNLTNSGSAGETPTDWLAIPQNAYPRPKGATPTRVSLVTAYNPCTAPDRTHGPPLAFGSCSSPTRTSSQLTVGTGDSNGKPALNEGYLTLTVMPGAPGGADDTDVSLTLFSDDVFTNALADYTGELRAHLTLQITDKLNTPNPGGPGAATTQQIPFDFNASCAAVADPNEGASCTAATSVDALVPGAAPEGRRAVWALAAVDVYDGGPDGDADTPAGDTLFATQGVFIP